MNVNEITALSILSTRLGTDTIVPVLSFDNQLTITTFNSVPIVSLRSLDASRQDPIVKSLLRARHSASCSYTVYSELAAAPSGRSVRFSDGLQTYDTAISRQGEYHHQAELYTLQALNTLAEARFLLGSSQARSFSDSVRQCTDDIGPGVLRSKGDELAKRWFAEEGIDDKLRQLWFEVRLDMSSLGEPSWEMPDELKGAIYGTADASAREGPTRGY
ncbi:hypothetical protein M231_02599 [Tremella mesenterica]|uniref:Uncharacterized protein n=1 Tax=Tremella mesenterica TaxID=5217 RepID=A0A4Q1BQD2_TREME|nr:uncharacterized protein TREMEDRAFT_61256 [Tremella mesenterica DSM 1558]EIW70748.1 hypothetical protein TREMEDRAFT_61256 [Tremella mesenterica DSM 1558]RXK40141.1 hypothetical protein M231_02599 [Tremella mesenterica]